MEKINVSKFIVTWTTQKIQIIFANNTKKLICINIDYTFFTNSFNSFKAGLAHINTFALIDNDYVLISSFSFHTKTISPYSH